MTEAGFLRILEELVDGGVEFVVVGGLALNSWGVIRGTKDVDVVLSSEPENLNRAAAVAVELGGHVQRSEAFASTAFSISALLGSGQQTVITTPFGALDVVQGLSGIPDFEGLRTRSVLVPISRVEVNVCSLEDLRAMKWAAGRPRDLVDLADLDAAHTPDPEL